MATPIDTERFTTELFNLTEETFGSPHGIFRHSALVDGQWKDCVYFDLLRSEWELARGRKPVAAGTRRVWRTGR